MSMLTAAQFAGYSVTPGNRYAQSPKKEWRLLLKHNRSWGADVIPEHRYPWRDGGVRCFHDPRICHDVAGHCQHRALILDVDRAGETTWVTFEQWHMPFLVVTANMRPPSREAAWWWRWHSMLGSTHAGAVCIVRGPGDPALCGFTVLCAACGSRIRDHEPTHGSELI